MLNIFLESACKTYSSSVSSDFELLLIDDGSTDMFGRICNEYAKINSHIKVFYNEKSGYFLTSCRKSCHEITYQWIS